MKNTVLVITSIAGDEHPVLNQFAKESAAHNVPFIVIGDTKSPKEFNIEGCDINWKACKNTRENLAHYNYTSNVYHSDIKDFNRKYDAAIIDLPYNLYTHSNDTIALNIIESAAKLTARIVIVSISDIETLIKKSGLKVSDFCFVEKRGKSKFTRNIWVCEKESSAN